MNILAQIVASKKLEIDALYRKYAFQDLVAEITSSYPDTASTPLFYQDLAEARKVGKPFFITEFKRKSPSEGWINQNADLSAQIQAYTQAGAGAISVLTDEPFFGGNYDDLKQARAQLDRQAFNEKPPLLLQKDFILDPIQIYLAKRHGADLILLIAAILKPEQLDTLRKTAESIGLGVLVEVHDASELKKIQHLDFQVLGVNNRDLKTFRTALNRVNVLAKQSAGRFVIAESGVLDHRHFQMVRNAAGFLIGTGLMSSKEGALSTLTDHFQSKGCLLFKACGIRTAETMSMVRDGETRSTPHFIGINFSPVSKRRAGLDIFEVLLVDTSGVLNTSEVSNAVAVFYQNTESEILEILQKHPFKTAQFYAGDVSPEFIRSLKIRVLLAVKISDSLTWIETITNLVEPYAADIDCFILDGNTPGSGERIGAEIPADFPYPFLLAGGLNEDNLEAVLGYKNCIGVDIASGIESEGKVDLGKTRRIAQRLVSLSLPHDL